MCVRGRSEKEDTIKQESILRLKLKVPAGKKVKGVWKSIGVVRTHFTVPLSFLIYTIHRLRWQHTEQHTAEMAQEHRSTLSR